MSRKHDNSRDPVLAPLGVVLLSLLAIFVHEVFQLAAFGEGSGWFSYPVTLLAGLIVAGTVAHCVTLWRKKNAPVNRTGKVDDVASEDAPEETERIPLVEEPVADYRAIFEASGVAMMILEEDTTISLVNREFEKLSGFSRKETEGKKSWTEFVTPESLERLRSYHDARRIDAHNVPSAYKVRFVDRSGGVREIFFIVEMLAGTTKSIGSAIDITEFRRTEAALMESEERYRTAIECSNDAVTIVQGDIRVYANQKFLDIFGYDRLDEVIGQPTFYVMHPDDRDRINEFSRRRQAGEPAPASYEFTGVRKDGTVIYIEASAAKVTYRGEPASLAYLRDVTERRKAEEQIKVSLREKEVLLKEVHHRVKNNLQVISSLLSLQAQTVKDDETRRLLEESRNRVKSMAYIHMQLYQSKNFAQIDFAPYVRNLAKNLLESHKKNGERVSLDVRVEDIFLSLDTAIPCGLIINELVSNALEHAFQNGRDGKIIVGLRKDGKKNMLVVSDNGVGLPREVDLHNTDTLGLQLVSALVDQLDGSLKLERGQGTVFRIAF
jgi:PAS domain S-box-containing protein